MKYYFSVGGRFTLSTVNVPELHEQVADIFTVIYGHHFAWQLHAVFGFNLLQYVTSINIYEGFNFLNKLYLLAFLLLLV